MQIQKTSRALRFLRALDVYSLKYIVVSLKYIVVSL